MFKSFNNENNQQNKFKLINQSYSSILEPEDEIEKNTIESQDDLDLQRISKPEKGE